MPAWQLALLLTVGAATLGGLIGAALFCAHLASERRGRR